MWTLPDVVSDDAITAAGGVCTHPHVPSGRDSHLVGGVWGGDDAADWCVCVLLWSALCFMCIHYATHLGTHE